MLAYAFTVLREEGYRRMATEEFANVADLLAAILARGIATQVKRGLRKDYIDKTESISSLRGKIDISESVKTLSKLRGQMVCSFDEFTVDEPMNRVLKATANHLIHTNIDKGRKKELRKLMPYFSEVSDIDLRDVNWNMHFDRNNQTYRMLMNICYLVYQGRLQTSEDGTLWMKDFIDETQMHSLYERFVRAYYEREYPDLDVSASSIDWQLDDDQRELLPSMISDVMIKRRATKSGEPERVLIIDTKYYGRMTQVNYGMHSIHSANLYQVFSYVKNKDLSYGAQPHVVSGMLLYAQTDEEVVPRVTYSMSGNKISVRSLDLSRDFDEIKVQLDDIVKEFLFGLNATVF